MKAYLIFAASLLAVSASAEDRRPSVLILFADDQRADTIAALGNAHIQTPNLDRLVKRGVSFDRAYMQGGIQPATCIPSRAMLLSGMPLFRADMQLRRDPTWPKAFADAGYATFLSGKWHNTHASIPLSFPTARSVFSGGMTDPRKAKLFDVTAGRMGKSRLTTQHACAQFADEAVQFIHNQKQPFLCYVPFDAPHDPHIVPDGFPVRYDVAKLLLPPNFATQHPFDNGEMLVRDEALLPWPRTEADIRTMTAEYYRYISYLDSEIGRILDAVEASPRAKSTYIVFAADSGVARGSHGLIGKQNLYEHSVRVPLVINGPGVPAGQRTNAMCYLFDLMPTLGKLCGVPAPKTSEGVEFSNVLTNPTEAGRERLMFAYRDVQRGLCDQNWKLIRYPQVNQTQLFDLQTDPHERHNLAGQPEHASRVAAMMMGLVQEQRKFGDTQPLKVADPKPAAWSPPAK